MVKGDKLPHSPNSKIHYFTIKWFAMFPEFFVRTIYDPLLKPLKSISIRDVSLLYIFEERSLPERSRIETSVVPTLFCISMNS